MTSFACEKSHQPSECAINLISACLQGLQPSAPMEESVVLGADCVGMGIYHGDYGDPCDYFLSEGLPVTVASCFVFLILQQKV